MISITISFESLIKLIDSRIRAALGHEMSEYDIKLYSTNGIDELIETTVLQTEPTS